MDGPFILTRSGQEFYYENIQPFMVITDDVVFALSNINRFCGHAGPYTVLQHTLAVEKVVRRRGGTRADRLSALFHDAGEAYVQDVPRPAHEYMQRAQGMSRTSNPLRQVEARVYEILMTRFNATEYMDRPSDLVCSVDEDMFLAEMAVLRGYVPPGLQVWTKLPTNSLRDVLDHCSDPEVARNVFSQLLADLDT